MKKFFLMFLIIGTSVSSFAQATKEYKGAVIDKNGNPLPGAKVEATGGAESTVTDADGTFTLEASQWLKSITVTYPGMAKKQKKIKGYSSNLVVEMGSRQSSQWFANVVGAYYMKEYECAAFGVMGGKKGYWGWYGKLMVDAGHPESNYPGADNPGIGFTVSGGVIKSLSKNAYVYLGAGFNKGYMEEGGYSTSVYGYYGEYEERYGAIVDLGFMYSIGKININAGVSIRDCFGDDLFDDGFAPGFQFGIGYSF